MTRNMRLLASASVLAAAAVAATPASAAGTAAGTTVTNTVTLDYKVGGIDQNQVSTSVDFTVDRKVNLTVSEVGTAATSVSPGQVAAVTAFTVTNASNAPLDFALATTQLNGGTVHTRPDNYEVSNVKIYADTNTNGTYDPGTDAEITYLDQVLADTSRTVFVVADVPLGLVTGDAAGIRLRATASEATAAGSLGSTVTQDNGANNKDAVDTVFADEDTDGNVARDGMHFDEDDYVILAASIVAIKTSQVISDPLNLTTNPKMIPGAVVEYCISVTNGASSATATGVNVSDALPPETTYDSAFGIRINGTTCGTPGPSGGSYASGIVSGTLTDIAAGETRTLVFRVSVN
jgi:uncharacterized repeat protein (TIGR01451 family)